MMNLSTVASKLYLEKGIWFSIEKQKISYPEEGNSAMFELEESSFWFKHRNNCIVTLVKKFTPDCMFFDIGGGNGFVSKGLQQSGISTVLIEPGLQGCINAQKRGLENIVCSTLEDAGFKPDSLESCGMFDVVEHIEDDTTFISSIYKFLKPGGYCFITVPAYQILWSNEDVDAGHYRRYTTESIKRLLTSGGFKINYISYFFSFLVLPVFLFRTIPSLWKKKALPISMHKKKHQSSGLSKIVVDQLCKREVNKINHTKKIRFGSSLLIVATKPL